MDVFPISGFFLGLISLEPMGSEGFSASADLVDISGRSTFLGFFILGWGFIFSMVSRVSFFLASVVTFFSFSTFTGFGLAFIIGVGLGTVLGVVEALFSGISIPELNSITKNSPATAKIRPKKNSKMLGGIANPQYIA